MEIIDKIKQLFKRKPRFTPYPHKTDLGSIVPAFLCNGVQYYEFEDISKMPFSRYAAVKDLLEMLGVRITREHLFAHTEYMKELLNKGKIGDCAIALDNLRNTISMCAAPTLVLKLAACIYFDETESLYQTSEFTNKRKIEDWLAADGLGFFLREPIAKYFFLKDISESDFEVYLKLATAETKLNLLEVLTTLKYSGLPKETLTELQWEVATLNSISKYLD